MQGCKCCICTPSLLDVQVLGDVVDGHVSYFKVPRVLAFNRGKVIIQRGIKILVRKVIPKQEDMSHIVKGLNPCAGKKIVCVKSLLKCNCVMVMLLCNL